MHLPPATVQPSLVLVLHQASSVTGSVSDYCFGVCVCAACLVLVRNDVPIYAGEAELWDEYKERAIDLYHGRQGEESKQKTTTLHLRAGLRGLAYEAVMGLKFSEP
eukprot:3983905-Amphidinium_carterae.2